MRDSAFHVALGKRLEQLRKRQQFSMTELAERIGVTPQALYAYEIGDRRVPTALLPALSQALRVSYDVLLGLTPAPQLPKWRASPAQLRHVEQLRKLAKRDRLAVIRITHALAKDSSREGT